jgi:hypothetical protein
VVPGHGEAAERQAVAAQRDYFERLYDVVSEAIQAGRPRAEVVRLVPPGLPGERAPLLSVNLGLVYDELDSPPAYENSLVSPGDET